MGVVAFPLDHRRDLIVEVSRELGSRHGYDATEYWKRTAKDLLQGLQVVGVAREAAECEVRSFLHAVLAELQLRSRAAAPG